MQDISGKSENHAGLITVAIGLVKLWSTKYEIQQHLWQRFIFTKTSQSGSTTNRIGAERYPLAETFSPCTVARDSNASQVEENQDGGWRVFFKRQVGMLLDDFVEINSSDLLWTCFRVVLFPPWQFQWNLCCLKFQETFGKPYNEQVTTFHGCPPLKRRFSGPFQMAGGWVNLLLHFPVQPRDLIREGLLQFSNFSDVLEGNGRMESFRDFSQAWKNVSWNEVWVQEVWTLQRATKVSHSICCRFVLHVSFGSKMQCECWCLFRVAAQQTGCFEYQWEMQSFLLEMSLR